MGFELGPLESEETALPTVPQPLRPVGKIICSIFGLLQQLKIAQ